MCVKEILFLEENKTMFEFEQAVTTKTILVTGVYKASFLGTKCDSIALAVIDIANFAFKWLTTAGAFLFFVLAHNKLILCWILNKESVVASIQMLQT